MVEAIVLIGFMAIDIFDYVGYKLSNIQNNHSATVIMNPEDQYRVSVDPNDRFKRHITKIEHKQEVESVENKIESRKRKLLLKTLSFMIALILHSSLEGFSFGVQKDDITVASLFFGLMIHKIVVAFSVGIRLTKCHSEDPIMITGLIFIFALTSPCLSIVGIVIQTSDIDFVLKNQMSTVLIALSMGTFLYITIYEMLCIDRENEEFRFLRLISTAIGIFVIAVVMNFTT
uniref:Zinc transporter ZIP3 n=1 Tax=Rhabditophanes sp. KR3021 TaxID=114890 RepID=A0AC35U8L0_9BILA